MCRGRRSTRGAHIINMKKAVFGCTVVGAAVNPKASASVSKHCVPVHTVLRLSVSSTSWMPGLCGPFWQTQLSRSSHTGMLPACEGAEGTRRPVRLRCCGRATLPRWPGGPELHEEQRTLLPSWVAGPDVLNYSDFEVAFCSWSAIPLRYLVTVNRTWAAHCCL